MIEGISIIFVFDLIQEFVIKFIVLNVRLFQPSAVFLLKKNKVKGTN